MITLARAEAEKYIRKVAKKSGLTFKRSNKSVNNSPAYHFQDRKSGIVVLENCSLSSAYADSWIGYIESYNSMTSRFDGTSL